jgi:hypothetical protein
MAYSKAKLKSSGDKASPCIRPFSMVNFSEEVYARIYRQKDGKRQMNTGHTDK